MSKGEAIYAVPHTGPMGLLYRDDLLKASDVAPPTTWDEFASAAVKYRAADPKSYLSNFAPNEAGQFLASMWQTGARPFSYDGDKTVKVDLASEQSKKLAAYRGDLIAKDAASVDPGLPAGHGEEDVRQVAGQRPAAMGCGRARGRQLGRFDRCGAEELEESDRGRPGGAVHQHRCRVRAEAGHRSVPVPGFEHRAGRAEVP